MSRTFRCEERTDEEREELRLIWRGILRDWLRAGNHCIHAPAGQLCDHCDDGYDEDPEAFYEFGDHAEGLANWEALKREIEQDADRHSTPAAEPDPNIPF